MRRQLLSGAIAVIMRKCIYAEYFFPSDKSIKVSDQRGYTVIFGDIRNEDKVINEVLLTVFRAPQSYTGENSTEISCHASPFIVRKILELLVNNGAKTAAPKSPRAFFNGKMDLSQAEAVADIIASKTSPSHK